MSAWQYKKYIRFLNQLKNWHEEKYQHWIKKIWHDIEMACVPRYWVIAKCHDGQIKGRLNSRNVRSENQIRFIGKHFSRPFVIVRGQNKNDFWVLRWKFRPHHVHGCCVEFLRSDETWNLLSHPLFKIDECV